MSGLSTRGLTVARGGRLAIEDVSFSARPGCLTAILGLSGAGKTTLLAACAGLLPAERGTVLIDGQVALGRSRRGIALLQPGFALPAGRTLQDALDRLAGRAGRPGLAAFLQALGLDRLAARTVGSLSHGESLLALTAARLAGASAGQALLVDEAGSGLDEEAAAALLALLKERARSGEAVVVATRHASVALAADHLILLHQGHILQAGTPASVYAEPCSPEAAQLTGPANILSGTVRELRPGGLLWSGGGRFVQAVDPETPRPPLGAPIRLCLRPERVSLLPPGVPCETHENQVEALVEEVVSAGPLLRVRLATAAGPLLSLSPAWGAPSYPAAGAHLRAGWLAGAGVILP